MEEITYGSISPLIQDVEVNGRQVRGTFTHLDGNTFSSAATIDRDNSAMSRVGRNVKNQLINRARATASQSIFRLLGGGILGRTGSTLIRASVSNSGSFQQEIDEEDINDAVVEAFKKIAVNYRFDENNGQFYPVEKQKQKIQIKGKSEEKTHTQSTDNPQSEKLNRLEKEVLARLLIEVADADGTLNSDENNMIRRIIPPELGSIEKIRNMDFISPLELKSLTQHARLEIIRSAFTMSFADLQCHERELAVIREYATQMGFNSVQTEQLAKEAKKEMLSSIIDADSTRSEVYEIAAQLNIPQEEAELILIHMKSRLP